MKKILKTSYPCLIKTDTDSCELEENDVLEIENEQFLFVYPQNGSIPFYIDTFSVFSFPKLLFCRCSSIAFFLISLANPKNKLVSSFSLKTF